MLLFTFGLTVLVDLTVAIEIGMVLAAFLFMRRMAEVTRVKAVRLDEEDDEGDLYATDPNGVRRRAAPPEVEVYEINGPFFFGAAHTLPLVALGRSAVLDEISEENIFGNIDDALNRARTHLGLPVVERPEFAEPTVARESGGHAAPNV